MRLLPLLATMFILVSCGNNSSSGGGTPSAQAPSRTPGTTQAEEACVAGDSCETVIDDEARSVDLLDSVISVPVEITTADITIKSGQNSVTQGEHISCSTSVQSGEVYGYRVSGDTLDLMTGTGAYTYTRLNQGGQGLQGTWTWAGKGAEGMTLLRTLAVVGNDRVIFKTHCEF
jgi:hypothetical protein